MGVEFSYVFNGLGTQVTLVEMMPQPIPMFDACSTPTWVRNSASC